MGETTKDSGAMATIAVFGILAAVILAAIAVNQIANTNDAISHDFEEVGVHLEDSDDYIQFTFERQHDYSVYISDATGEYITAFCQDCTSETTMEPPYNFKLAKDPAWVLDGATVTITDEDTGQASAWVWGE